jgi:NCAIR mutase (PurE)-related protein
MKISSFRDLLERVRDGKISVEEALEQAPALPFKDLGFAKVDHHRAIRCGYPEVILCQGKEPAQIGGIAKEILKGGGRLLATRAGVEAYEAIRAVAPDAVYHEKARAVTVGEVSPEGDAGKVLVVSAGTSDIPVAEEARVTAEAMGTRVETLYDVGVAGIHRLLESTESILEASVIIVVAGMEGALASVVGGLTDRPVIAVPTSVGYGASFGGIAPLLTMLNSCAAGVSVVNIDNGFGAGYVASLILKKTGRSEHAGK